MLQIIGDILSFPLLLTELAVEASGFSVDAFARAAASEEAKTAAIVIAFLAGISEMLGQSVILVVNRVVLYRFIASLLFTGVTYVVTALTWAASALLIAPLTRVGDLTVGHGGAVIGIVCLAFAPRLLGFISIAPYFGVAFGNLLEAWAMVLAIFGLHAGLDMPLGGAVVCGVAGWIVSYGFRSFLGHALAKPLGRIRIMVSGSPLDKSPQQIIDEMLRALRRETNI